MYAFAGESLVGQCDYTTQPKGVMLKGAVLSLKFIKKITFHSHLGIW